MTKVNEQFLEAMQKRLNEKEGVFVGGLNYKNISVYGLSKLIFEDANILGWKTEPWRTMHSDDMKKLCVDISNRCWMLWERLDSK